MLHWNAKHNYVILDAYIDGIYFSFFCLPVHFLFLKKGGTRLYIQYQGII